MTDVEEVFAALRGHTCNSTTTQAGCPACQDATRIADELGAAIVDRRMAEVDNAARLRYAMSHPCAMLPGCPGEHNEQCPRYPPRWAVTDYAGPGADSQSSTVPVQPDAAPGEPPAAHTPATGGSPSPEPLLAGTFALYADERGGLVLVTDIPGQGVQHKQIPAAMVRAGMALAGGGDFKSLIRLVRPGKAGKGG